MAIEREKLTVTIRKDLFAQIDSMIDGNKIRNRSHATEYLITKGLGLNRVNNAFILAGGKGTRLRPITYELPTPLIPIKGQPLIAHTLQLLAKHGVRDVMISVGYKKKQIKEALGDGKRYGVSITYVEESRPLGTAGPLRLAKKHLTEPFFLIWGDVLANIDLFDLAQFHKDNGGVATIALSSIEDTSHMGVVEVRGNQVEKFIEKPKPGKEPSKLVSAGIAVCNPDIIKLIGTGKQMMEKDVYPKLAIDEQLIGYNFSGQWFDMSSNEIYEQAVRSWHGIK